MPSTKDLIQSMNRFVYATAHDCDTHEINFMATNMAAKLGEIINLAEYFATPLNKQWLINIADVYVANYADMPKRTFGTFGKRFAVAPRGDQFVAFIVEPDNYDSIDIDIVHTRRDVIDLMISLKIPLE